MRFDIVRAWKDEIYRQSLSAEQLQALPANPVGELADADLATVSGAGGGGGFPVGGGIPSTPGGLGTGGAVPPIGGVVGTNQASLLQAKNNFESLAATDCECNWISMDTVKVSGLSFVSFGSPITQICANTH